MMKKKGYWHEDSFILDLESFSIQILGHRILCGLEKFLDFPREGRGFFGLSIVFFVSRNWWIVCTWFLSLSISWRCYKFK